MGRRFAGAHRGKMTPDNSMAIVGADGYLGQLLAREFSGARKIVFRSPLEGETSFANAQTDLESAEVIINVSGFRVRQGLSDRDYFDSHVETTRVLANRIPRSKMLVHFSSASVMGRNRLQPCSSSDQPMPETFPIPAYAQAKLESERVVREIAEARGFEYIIVRPGVVYSPEGGSFVSTLCRLLRFGWLLKFSPMKARHHFCSGKLLLASVRALAEQRAAARGRTWMVADPFTISNAQLADDIRSTLLRRQIRPKEICLPARPLENLLRLAWHSSNPHLDFKTLGGIFGAMALNSVFDSEPLFSELGLPREQFGKDCEWREMIEREVAA